MLTIVLCDDIELHLKKAEQLVSEIMEKQDIPYEIRLFHDAETMLSHVEFNEVSPDIAILDIEMDGENGISLAKKLNQAVPKCPVIFLTSYVDYASTAYEAEHIWFVVKNRTEEYLEPALKKALAVYRNSQNRTIGILVRDNRKATVIPLEKILYISKVGRKAQIRCTDGEYFDTRSPSAMIPEELSAYFMRCHQGYWVNFKMIRELDKDELVFPGDIRVPISRRYREEVRRKFFDSYHFHPNDKD
ncbi:MAG: response regulator transcription factor [Solobacterium sp.]|nr:response regulator transcription factor [Solobacterium sp.]